MLNRIRLYLAAYRYISIPSVIVTIICVFMYRYAGVSGINPLSWMKLFTTGIFLFFINYSKRHEFYYYYNLGITKRSVFIIGAVADILLYTIAMMAMVHYSSVIMLHD